MASLILGIAALVLWLIIAALPWRPWSTREQLDTLPSVSGIPLDDVTVLIPARNEAEVIADTLQSVSRQGNDVPIIVVNDQSTDDTRAVIDALQMPNVTVIDGRAPAAGWSGKLSALEQGRTQVTTTFTLLLDADITLLPGILATLKHKAVTEDLTLVSLMAELKMQTLAEKLLMPAFIYFFKLLYPFALSNRPAGPVAAAAGGVIFIKTAALEEIGGFGCIKDALIDDCSLAAAIKQQGHKTWIGLTHSAISQRSYEDFSGIWEMVTRTAFTQLRYSYLLLLICLLLMTVSYLVPVMGLFFPQPIGQLSAGLALLLLLGLYLPTLSYYQLSPIWCLSLPLAAILYMLMTLDSARQHGLGQGATWKGRHYQNQ